MKWSVTLEKDEDGYWVVECPSLPGCVSQGKSRQEALENIREAIVGWLEVEAETRQREAVQAHQDVELIEVAA